MCCFGRVRPGSLLNSSADPAAATTTSSSQQSQAQAQQQPAATDASQQPQTQDQTATSDEDETVKGVKPGSEKDVNSIGNRGVGKGMNLYSLEREIAHRETGGHGSRKDRQDDQ